MTKDQQKLTELIEEKLDTCCPTNLTKLKKFISTDNGKEVAVDMIFGICDSSGISVQSAMAQLDSDL